MQAQFVWDQTHMIRLLKQTYSGSNATLQKVAQKQLHAIESNPNFVPAMNEIILNQHLQTDVRSAAALCLARLCKSQGDKIPQNMLIVLFELMESEISIHLKRQVANALRFLLTKETYKEQRLDLPIKLSERLREFATTVEVQARVYEALVMISNVLVTIPPFTEVQGERRVAFIPLAIDFGLKFMVQFTNSLKSELTQPILQRLLWITREVAQLVKSVMKYTQIQQNPHHLALLCYNNLDPLLSLIILLKIRETDTALFSQGDDKLSNTLNESKMIALQCIDLLVKRILTAATRTNQNLSGNCPTMANLSKYLHVILQDIIIFVKTTKYYDMEEKAVELLTSALKLVRTSLRQPTLDSFFGGCRQQLVLNIILPLLELSPTQKDNYEDDPEDFINYVFGIVNRQRGQEEDDVWNMQIQVAQLLSSFCDYQHGVLMELFKYAFTNISTASFQDAQKLLLMICILRDDSKDRPEVHEALKAYIQSEMPNLLNPLQGDLRILRTLKFYIIHKYTIYISKISQQFISISANLAVQVVKSQALRSDQALQIVALQILSNMCTVGQILMQNTANPTFLLLISLINQPVNHRLLDAIQQLISSYSESLSDELIIKCVQELVKKIQQCTQDREPPVAANKCWNIIRQIGSNNKLIPRLIPPIEAEVHRLQKYLKEPENIDFEEDFLLLCTDFIRKSKSVTASQLSLFESFWKIFEKYEYTFGHMFETLSYFIVYGAAILKSSPKAIEYLVQICIKSITLPDSPKASQADQCQGVLLLQSLILCCYEAFTPESLMPIIQTLRQRLQLPIKFNFLKANLLCGLGISLVKIWKGINNSQSQLLLNLILSDTSCFKTKHPNTLFILILCQLLVFQDPIVYAKMSAILKACVSLFKDSYKQKIPDTHNLYTSPSEDTASKQYHLALETYLNPIENADELDRFKQTFEFLKKERQEQLAFAVSQLSQQQQEYLVNMLRTTKVGGDARIKLVVRKGV